MSGRIAWLALVLAGCGLTVVGTDMLAPTPVDGGGQPYGADADTTHAADAVAQEGSEDAGLPLEDGCAEVVVDDFTQPNAGWSRDGLAVFDGGKAVLVVPPVEQQHGAIFIPVPAVVSPATRVEATFTMNIVRYDGSAADGVALVWASDNGVPHIGGTGGHLGFCPDGNSDGKGPIGAAFVLDVNGNKAGVLESDGIGCTDYQSPPSLKFNDTQVVTVKVVGKNVQANIKNASGDSNFGFIAKKDVPIRWVGLTSATGGVVAQFSVDNVSIKACR